MTPLGSAVSRLQVLGPVVLHRTSGGASVPQLTQPRPLAVLSYLVLARPRRMHSRDTLLALLWPESDQARGRHALRNVLHSLRKALGDHVLVAGGDDQVGVAPGSILCDGIDLEGLVAREEWEAALTLYQGDLLSGFHVGGAPEFEEWLYQERRRLRDLMVHAATALAAVRLEAGDLQGAIRATERRVQLAPDEEAGQRQLMELLGKNGERAAALRVYERLEERVRLEYGSEPSQETREVLRALKRPEWATEGSEQGTGGREREAARLEVGSGPGKGNSGEAAVGTGARARRGYLAAGAAAVAIATGLFAAARSGPSGPAAGTSLFVAPIVNATGDTTATWLGEGLAISLREQFRRAGWQLVPESRVRRAMREHSTPEAAAASLRAALLIAGRTDSASGHVRLRITARRAGELEPLATADAIVQPNRLLDAELEAVGSLIEQLRPDLAADSVVAALRRGTDDDAAYRFYLQGWYLWDRRYSLADMQLAAARFDSALAHDPVYADALAARARVRFALAWSGNGPEKEGIAAARADARRAVELDSTSRVALSVLGAVETFRDSALARRLLERAVALDPDRSDTYFLLGLHYGFRGEYALAERAYRRATELEPLAPFPYSRLVAVQICQGAYERALESMARWRGVSERPELLRSIDYRRASVLMALNRWRDAVPLLRTVMGDTPDLAEALAHVQSEGELQDVLRRHASRQSGGDGLLSLTGQRRGQVKAQIAMRTGHRDDAIRMLVEARRDGDVTLPMACEDPLLQSLARVPQVAQAMRPVQTP